jgi:LCP family protein required for cell wall assembly
MSRKRTLIIAVIVIAIIILLSICIGIFYGVNTLYTSPMGPTLEMPTGIPMENPANPLAATQGPFPTPILPTAIPSKTPPSAATTQAAICGQSGSTNILTLGVDSPFPSGVRGPLVIRIVKVDFSQKTAVVFAFPRDLWVSVGGLEGYGLTQGRLNQVYLFARDRAGYNDAAATNLIAQSLYRDFGARSDHYAIIRLSNLAWMIDTVGGLDLYIPVVYDGTPYGFHYFGAGQYHLNGALALEYAMAPSPAQQWNGLARQNQILQALLQKLQSTDIISRLPSLVQQFFYTMTTDYSLQQMLDLVCILREIPADRITYVEAGPSDVIQRSDGSLISNGDSIRRKVEQYLGT